MQGFSIKPRQLISFKIVWLRPKGRDLKPFMDYERFYNIEEHDRFDTELNSTYKLHMNNKKVG